jgi:protein tyrosine phosphatase
LQSQIDKHNRIHIEAVDNFYLNASLMKSVLDQEVYAVFAQAPVLKVIEHFWYACYHYNIPKIVMLCALEDPHRGVPPIRDRPRQKDIGPH